MSRLAVILSTRDHAAFTSTVKIKIYTHASQSNPVFVILRGGLHMDYYVETATLELISPHPIYCLNYNCSEKIIAQKNIYLSYEIYTNGLPRLH